MIVGELMNEIWVPLIHENVVDGYEISSKGRIRIKNMNDEYDILNFSKQVKRNHVRLVNKTNDHVIFKTTPYFVSTLVAEAFIPIPDELKDCMVIAEHINQNDCYNDSCNNLKWIKYEPTVHVYDRKQDKRFTVTYKNPDGTNVSMSYPRYIMEKHLGRKLLPSEDVHHIDEDVTNNDISNLSIIDHVKHVSSHTKYVYRPIVIACDVCQKIFTLNPKTLREYIHSMMSGRRRFITCSKSCAGYIGRRYQSGDDIEIPDHSDLIILREHGSIH